MELDLIATSTPRLSLLNTFNANCAEFVGMLCTGIPDSRINLKAMAFSLVGSCNKAEK